MIHTIILICSIYVPREHCNERTAIDKIIRDVPFGIMGMGAEVEIADMAQGVDWSHYPVIIARR